MHLTVITAAWRLEGLKNIINILDNQTYNKFEHIIVRDCSKQISSDELKKLCMSSPNRHWIDLGIHTGYYGCFARNIGIMASFTYFAERVRKIDEDFWVTFLDDDNEWYPDYVEKFVAAHSEHPNATLIGGSAIEQRGKKNTNYCKFITNKFRLQHTDIGAWFYKKELFDKYGYFNGNLTQKVIYDYKLLEKILQGEGKDKIYIMPQVIGLIFYHKRR